MTMRINSIILYNENGEHRELSFKEGVNIITGTKNTGKFAIIPIIEYCLGNSKLNIVGSVVRENVAFYAVIYQFSDRQVIIAKPKPIENRVTKSRAFYKEGQSIVIPTLTELRNNLDTDDTVVKNKLSHLLGIESPFSIQDTFFLLFQDKQTIDRNNIIFYQQDNDNIRKNISDILSYFLGIIKSEDIELKNTINVLTKQIKEKSTELKKFEERNHFKFTEGQHLLEKATRLNLIAQDTVAKDFSELQQLFQIVLQKIKSLIQSQPNTLLKGIDEISAKKLDQEIFDLNQEKNSLKDDISELESYLSAASKYDSNTQEQINRLKSIHLFSNNANLFLEADKCPLCFSTLETEIIPKVQAIQTEIKRLDSHIKSVEIEQKETSDINKRLSDLKIQSKQLKQDIQNRNKEKKRIEDNNSQAQSFYQQALSANQTLSEIKGAIENYLENLSNDKSNTFLHGEIKSLNEKIEKLKQQQAIEKEAQDTYGKGCLKHINEKMKSFAQQLGLEDEPFDFDVKKLKIYYIDRHGKTKELVNVTGKSEIVGCHLSLCLALHSFFSKKLRPVPSFIVLDQPAQGYTETTDKEKISTMFSMFFELCKSMNIQVIITEHVNLQNSKKFKEALVENYWIGEQDRALIPNQWKNSQ